MKSLKFFKDKVKAKAYRNRQRKINYLNGGFVNSVPGRGLNYTDYEDRLILNSKSKDRMIAQMLQRSVRSIQIRRSRIK